MDPCNISTRNLKKIWLITKIVSCSSYKNIHQSGGAWNPKFSTISTPLLNQSINVCIQRGNLKDAREFFDQYPLSRNVVSWNSMISGYFKHGQIKPAQQLFDEMPMRDIVSYNAILSGMHMSKDPHQVYLYFLNMARAGHKPNEFTFSIVITSLLRTSFNPLLLTQLHGLALRCSLNSSVFVGSALIRAYCDIDNLKCLRKVFDDIAEKDVSSWNAILLSYMDMGLTSEAERAFDVMPETNIISWTTLINGYINNKNLNRARYIFQKASEKNVVMWTSMINGYTQNSMFVEALELFVSMLNLQTRPNCFTFSTVLNACSGSSAFLTGKQVHSLVLKYGFDSDVVSSTALLNMYGNCGDIEAATTVFECITQKNLTTWNSIIGCYSRHGEGVMALETFYRLTRTTRFKPDRITFVNVLSACGRAGLVEEGEWLFDCMRNHYYGVEVEMEHYACMVDLYGRAGFLNKAVKLMEGMTMEPDVVVWGALLAGCCWHSCSELGEFAARGLYKLKEDHPAIYSSLSKIHGDNCEWITVADIKSLVKRKQIEKQKAGSWIDS
ncbi:pentatricopeptide repeat-containing protein At1g09410, mitochondrial-like [Impatiens glandulifera]|uniref:pentatricopeptide repeat-containing protein At1g09410, mitochondrial-like n=1 Tax=Impatiens glandulifera TaxID=253017 RepID=UPI001FB1820D|nr:pentatricopeptide repeat-containing protein At1g09410, mitochondrial-like [Impatiens glandulifera]